MKIFNIIISVSALLLLYSATSSQTNNINKQISNDIQPNNSSSVQNTENLVHIGDIIDVDVVGSTEYDWRGGLSPEGFLDGINFVEEPIYALCRTTESVAADVAKGYEKILKNPQITVKIIDRSHRPVTLLNGAVKTPQRFQIYRAVNLNELLILSGGITEKASGDIQIMRSPNLSCSAKKESEQQTAVVGKQPETTLSEKQDGSSQYINIKISDLLKGQPESNPLILSGDVVTIFESKPIYMIGAVTNPKQINARTEISISRAIDAVGGLAKNADSKKVTVFRAENNQTKVIDIDLDRIKSGQDIDFMLKPFDIVEVSQKGRNRGKYLPPSESNEEDKRNIQNLPLKVID